MSRLPALLLASVLAAVLASGLSGCDKPQAPADQPAQERPATAAGALRVLASSELKDLEPALVQAGAAAGVRVQFSYAGTLEMVERIDGGEDFDALLPANGAYPSMALARKPVAREKLFYSRVVLGVKERKARELGWVATPPNWAQIAEAAGRGQLRHAMTNPANSNTGMSALFAVASAVAGKTEDLQAHEVDGKVLTAFMAGQKLTAGSSGWLSEAFVREAPRLDAMVNYEAVLLRLNAQLAPEDRLRPIEPRDGVISADYPLLLLQAARRAEFDQLVAAWKAPAFQRDTVAAAYLRPSVPGVALAPGLSTAAVAELAFPNRLEVVDAVLGGWQERWRRPSTSIFVLDVSGSMRGDRIEAMRAALKVLAGAEASSASARYARFQARERVQLITFNDQVAEPQLVNFADADLAAARAAVVAAADGLKAKGGTAIYEALGRAQALAAEEQRRDPGRFVSIVLLSDGENTSGTDFLGFRKALGRDSARVFPILFGEANPAEMTELAQLTGGRVFDGRRASLGTVFREIRGYQ